MNARGSTGSRNFGSIDEQALFIVPDVGYDIIQPREAFVPVLHSVEDGPTGPQRLLSKIARALPRLPEQIRDAGAVLDQDEMDEWRDLSTRELEFGDDEDLDDEEGGMVDPEDVPDEKDPAVYWRGAVRTGQGTSFRTQRKNQFYPLLFNPKKPERIEVGEPLLKSDDNGVLVPPSWEKVRGLTPIWPVDEEGAERVWCYEPGRMRAEIAKGNIRVGRFNDKRKTYAVNVRRVRRTRQRFRELTVWWEQSYDAGSNGTNILKNLLGSSGQFPFPKSIYAVRDVLSTVVGSRPDALILDFFAGSGTTLHATCLLNSIDNGKRRCILVTNNEVDEKTAKELAKAGHHQGDLEYEALGIFQRVTVPRVTAAITGQRQDGSLLKGNYKWAGKRPLAKGFEENVEFYELRYLDPDEVELGEQFQSIHPLLWLAAGASGDREKLSPPDSYYISARSHYAVLFSPSRLKQFVEALEKRPDVKYVWVVTDSEEAYAEACELLPDNVVHTSQLYDDYLRTFRINTRRNR